MPDSPWRLRPKALADIEAIGDFIAQDNPARAKAVVEALLDTCERIAQRPLSHQRRDDLAAGLRQAIHRRYLILFTVDTAGVVIERVVHGARRLEDVI